MVAMSAVSWGTGPSPPPSMHQRARSDVRYALLANDATPRASAAVEVKAAPIQEGSMDIGVVFPQVEIGPDPARIRDYAQAVEGMGYTHVLAFDHVLGANPERPGGWKGPYTHRHAFHEPFVLFGFLAGVTSRLGLATGILILPQRQTALAAKQAAAVDVLSGGRLRLGVGVGWNAASSRRWARTSRTAASASRSRSRSCARSGPRSW